MTNNLVERYVKQVGRYLPESEREEVQKELRSLIQDQLDDRYKGAPTEDDIVEVLTELGDPRQMAASYNSPQYLIGPDLYPMMLYVLQRGWVWIPIIVVIVRTVVAFVGAEPGSLIGLLLGTIGTVVQALFIFSAVVVLIFALLERYGDLEDMEELQPQPFDPRDLPDIKDPAGVDRGEVAVGVAFSAFFALVLGYFLRVGGLTLVFNLSEPPTVIPVPTNWLIIDIAALVGIIMVNLIVLKRDRWTVGLVLADLALDIVSVVAGYFVIIEPLFGWLYEQVPALMNVPFVGNGPLLVTIILGILTMVDSLTKLGKMLFGGSGSRPTSAAQPTTKAS